MKQLMNVMIVAVVLFAGSSFAACPSGDLTGNCFVDFEDFSVIANQWLTVYDYNDLAVLAVEWLTGGIPENPAVMAWVSINDPGVSGHEPFNGQMSKYETTNAQYCQFLNAALASGDITVGVDDVVDGADGANGGADFVGEVYFYTSARTSYSQITFDGETFSVRSRDGYDMSNHPVVVVSWYGATAFCYYYGFRLPTEWEWQAVADYDGSYIYGCGTTIDLTRANYWDDVYANPLNLFSYPYTSPVDYYPSYGYGLNNMAGNVGEWTDSIYPAGFHVTRGGFWVGNDTNCTVSYWNSNLPSDCYTHRGFRVCR